MILLKNNEIIDFWTWPPTDFSALRMFKLKCYLIFKNRYQVTADDVTVTL